MNESSFQNYSHQRRRLVSAKVPDFSPRFEELVEYLGEGLTPQFDLRSGPSTSDQTPSRVAYEHLAAIIFPERRCTFWYSNLWNMFKAYAERAVEQHPYQYSNTDALWTEAPPIEECPDPDHLLSDAGVLMAIDAWCQQSIIAPATFTTEELDELHFWQCLGPLIVDDAFGMQDPKRPPMAAVNPEQEQGLSNLRMQEAIQQYLALSGQRQLKHNRERYATHFSLIQAFGLHYEQNYQTGHREAKAFFLPAHQILQNMMRYFKSSTAFEEQRWRSVGSYSQYAQFTNVMLLNLCHEVIRQITTMFRIQEAAGGVDLLMPIKQLLEADLLASCDLPTQTELILSHAEPRHWIPQSASICSASSQRNCLTQLVVCMRNRRRHSRHHQRSHLQRHPRRQLPPQRRECCKGNAPVWLPSSNLLWHPWPVTL